MLSKGFSFKGMSDDLLHYNSCSRVNFKTVLLCVVTLRINSINIYLLNVFPFVFICYHDFWPIWLQVNLIRLYFKEKKTQNSKTWHYFRTRFSWNPPPLSSILQVVLENYYTVIANEPSKYSTSKDGIIMNKLFYDHS